MVLTAVARLSYNFVYFRNVSRNLRHVRVGESEAEVLRRVGTPDGHRGSCGTVRAAPRDCALEFVYSHPFAPAVKDYYIVSFSRDEKVIAVDHWNEETQK